MRRDLPSNVRRRVFPALAFSFCALFGLGAPTVARAEVQVGATLENVEIRDARDQPLMIPGLGEKVLLILYTDPDVADQNDKFGDMLKATELDRTVYQSIAIANMEDAPTKPNWIIRAIIRSKIKKYNITILTDPKKLLLKAWDLGDSDEKSVVLLIGKDKKLKYFKKGPINVEKDGPGPTEFERFVTLLRKTISEAGGTSQPAPATPAPSPASPAPPAATPPAPPAAPAASK